VLAVKADLATSSPAIAFPAHALPPGAALARRPELQVPRALQQAFALLPGQLVWVRTLPRIVLTMVVLAPKHACPLPELPVGLRAFVRAGHALDTNFDVVDCKPALQGVCVCRLLILLVYWMNRLCNGLVLC
jgi:hypothetical protein